MGRQNQLLLGLPLIAGSVLLGCATHAPAPSTTRIACGQCEEADRFVRLQTVRDDGRSEHIHRFTHPVALHPEDWKSILSQLQVQRQAEGWIFPTLQGPVTAAFTEDEITSLSVMLSKAFAQARADELVVFVLSRMTPQGLTELTTGGWYVQGQALHLVLANYRKAATMPTVRQMLWDQPLRPDAGPAYDLVAGHHQAVVRAPSPDVWSHSPSELTIAYQALLLGEPVAASRQDKPEGNSSVASPSLSLEERLQVLKRLQAQGLITQEEYRTKKQQLLDQF